MSRTSLPIRPRTKKPTLRVADILKWADDFRARHGRWPHMYDGVVEGTADQTWAAADQALRSGRRGLPGGTSLAKLLLKRRGRRHWHMPPDLSLKQILTWADAHHRRTGDWPGGHCTGQIPNAPKGLTWVAVELALQRGKRNLPGGTTLAQLLERHCGVRNRLAVPYLTEAAILAWADDHHTRNREWPKYPDGAIAAAPGETWHAVDRKDKTRWAMVGSANLTRPGLSTSQEACVIFDDNEGDEVALDDIRDWLNVLLNREYEPIDFNLARAIFATRNRQNAGGVRATAPGARYWALKPGYCGEYWDRFLAENVVAMGWEPMPDTSGMGLEDIEAAYRETWPDDSDGTVGTNSRQIHAFTGEMGAGELVLLCSRWDSTPTGSPNVYLYGIARTLSVGGRCYFYDTRSNWWHFKRHATIQRIEAYLPRGLVATASGVGAFVPTIRTLTRTGVAGLERILRRELGFVVSV